MSIVSRRLATQPNPAYTTRRTLLKLAAAIPLATTPVAAAAACRPAAAVPQPMAKYYTFILLELAELEQRFGLVNLEQSAESSVIAAAAAMRSGSTIAQRYEWMMHFTETRALFSVAEA